jgi:N,N'-diacetyllegionaminate synthase
MLGLGPKIMESKMLIIAEAGVNHNGSLEMAKKMVDAAAVSGADIIKFQTFEPNELAMQDTPLAEYQTKSYKGTSQHQLLESLAMSRSDFESLSRYVEKSGLEFLSTGFDIDSVRFLIDLGIKRIKIPSGELFNFPLMQYCFESKLPVIISTGMTDLFDIQEILNFMEKCSYPKSKATLLQCTTSYPTKLEDANIRSMILMRDAFEVDVGFSDHTLGYIASQAAVANGAVILEKHFTLDKSLPGPDHAMSLNSDELKSYVEICRQTQLVMGSSIKSVLESEKENVKIVRRGLYAKRDMKAGTVLAPDDFIFRRPMLNFSPKNYFKMINKPIRRNIAKDEGILEQDINQ